MSKITNKTVPTRFVDREGVEISFPGGLGIRVEQGGSSGEGARWGWTVALLRAGREVASASVGPAIGSPVQRRLSVPDAPLERTAYLGDIRCESEADLAPLVYFALRQARIRGFRSFLLLSSSAPLHADMWESRLGVRSIGEVKPTDGSGEEGRQSMQAMAQRLSVSLAKAYRWSGELGTSIGAEVFADELGETLERWILGVYGEGFFKAIRERRLHREQYLYAASNMHHFVRWTTRLLGRAVSVSHDKVFRDQFLHHLQEEVNHEVIIERDLKHLGADLELQLDQIPPNAGVRAFMAIQESRIGFHEDPLTFLASPLAAEGIASHLDGRFMEDLCACIASWGVEEPVKAARFFESHIAFDGGEHGHWESGLAFVASRLTSERELQHFLSVLRGSMHGLSEAYRSFVEDLAVFDLSW